MNDKEQAKELFLEGLASLDKGDFKNSEILFLETLKLAPRSVPTLNNLAIAQYEQRNIADAVLTTQKALDIDPQNIGAYLMLSSCQKEQGRYEDVLKTCQMIIGIDPTIAEAHCNLGYAFNKTEKYHEAIASFDRAITLEPRLADAFLNRANALRSLERYDDAFVAYDKALTLNPGLAGAWLGRGNVFAELRRFDESFSAYDKALELKPDLAEAWLGRANVFTKLKRYDEASAACDKALAVQPELAEAWLGRASIFTELKRYDEAFAAYDKALDLKPDFAEAWLGRARVFAELKRYNEAFVAYDKASAIKSDSAEPWLGRGHVFYDLTRYEEALAAYDKALSFKPDLTNAWVGRGNIFSALKRYEEAIAAYDKGLIFERDLNYAEGARLYAKMHLCDWSNFDAERTHLLSSVRKGALAVEPFHLIAISSSPDEQLQYAKLLNKAKYPPSDRPIWHGERYDHDRIRVAYLSADFRDHATSHLIAGAFEQHDRKRFETIAISFGPDSQSEMRTRIKKSFDQFIDVGNRDDVDVATLLRALEVDVAVDLMGYTAYSRTAIFAHRPVPIQVNYLGYPATMGAPYIDYLIADQVTAPRSHQAFFAEKLLCLPGSYQANDTKRVISEKSLTRAEFGLPEKAIIFCCFNNSYKISPDVFDSWMRILQRVENSILWLLEDNATAVLNLKKEARIRGIDPERLVFAKRLPVPEHLARHKLADLFLDTSPYNAHTTGSDALWAGLPVLTVIGETFAARVAASLLTAIGLPELITSTSQAYVDLAIELANNPEKLAAIKYKLAKNRLTTSLFDTRLFARHIEAAYTAMYERYQANLQPDHMYVPQ